MHHVHSQTAYWDHIHVFTCPPGLGADAVCAYHCVDPFVSLIGAYSAELYSLYRAVHVYRKYGVLINLYAM